VALLDRACAPGAHGDRGGGAGDRLSQGHRRADVPDGRGRACSLDGPRRGDRAGDRKGRSGGRVRADPRGAVRVGAVRRRVARRVHQRRRPGAVQPGPGDSAEDRPSERGTPRRAAPRRRRPPRRRAGLPPAGPALRWGRLDGRAGPHTVRRRHHLRLFGGRDQRRLPRQGARQPAGHLRAPRPVGRQGRRRSPAQRPEEPEVAVGPAPRQGAGRGPVQRRHHVPRAAGGPRRHGRRRARRRAHQRTTVAVRARPRRVGHGHRSGRDAAAAAAVRQDHHREDVSPLVPLRVRRGAGEGPSSQRLRGEDEPAARVRRPRHLGVPLRIRPGPTRRHRTDRAGGRQHQGALQAQGRPLEAVVPQPARDGGFRLRERLVRRRRRHGQQAVRVVHRDPAVENIVHPRRTASALRRARSGRPYGERPGRAPSRRDRLHDRRRFARPRRDHPRRHRPPRPDLDATGADAGRGRRGRPSHRRDRCRLVD
jgi:hypothetical protein